MLKIYEYKDISSKEALKKTLKNYNINNIELVYNEYGKPYLKDNAVYFNISHTKNTIVIAVSDTEVGIDIQYKCYKPRVKDKYFTKSEIEYIDNALDKEDAFTRVWVKKEAYVKMLGQGLSYGLKNVDTNSLNIDVQKKDNLYMAVCLKNS